MQVGVGSGVKCGVNVWVALRDIDDVHAAWEHRVVATSPTGGGVGQRQRRRLPDGTWRWEPRAPPFVDVSGLGRAHVLSRLTSLLLLLALWMVVLQLCRAQGPDVVTAPPSSSSYGFPSFTAREL